MVDEPRGTGVDIAIVWRRLRGLRTPRTNGKPLVNAGPDEPDRLRITEDDLEDSPGPPGRETIALPPMAPDAPPSARLIVKTDGVGRVTVRSLPLVVGPMEDERPAPGRPAAPAPVALQAVDLFVTTPSGMPILEGVNVSAGAGTLTAIVGPTGAGKSTLLRALTGGQPPSSGRVLVGGYDLYEHYADLATQIGHVPQDDIVHTQLTARQALTFGAELRFPTGTPLAVCEQRVEEVLASLGLTEHGDKPITRLSGGQRKRVSVALEMLTEPRLLLLDEPTSGLDPAYEKSIMELLRKLADGGRTVVVVTHSVASLDLCDQVVFLGNGGWVGYAGPLPDAMAHFRTNDFPEIFRYLDQPPPVRATPGPAPSRSAAQLSRRPSESFRDKLGVLVRRNVAIIQSDRRAVLVLAAAALVPAFLLLALIDSEAFTPGDTPSSGGRTLIAGMVVTLGVIGAANGIREIVKESAIYRRERGTGLSRSAYIVSKVLVLGTITVVQAAMVLIVATFLTGVPGGAVLPAFVEMLLALALTGLVTLALGLAVSSVVSSSEKAMALVPVLFVLLWLFSGSVADLAGKPVLSQIAYVSPSNWGMAAAAGTVDLYGLERCDAEPLADPVTGAVSETADNVVCDARWETSAGSLFAALIALAVLGGVSFLVTDWALAQKEPVEAMRRDNLISRALGLVR